jgi:hypothetical protein
MTISTCRSNERLGNAGGGQPLARASRNFLLKSASNGGRPAM